MNLSIAMLWALVGWCGTPFPGWWRFPPRPNPPDPNPLVNIWLVKTIGALGGLAGGTVYTQAFPIGETLSSLAVAPTAIGAVVGAIFLTDLYVLARGAAISAQAGSIRTNS